MRVVSRPGMARVTPRVLVLSSVLLAASLGAWQGSTEAIVTVNIEGDTPSVVAFLPPSMQSPADNDAAEARERVRSAIEDVKLCLGESGITYRVIFADRITVRSLGHERTFEVDHFAPLVGALLLRPDSSPRILFAGGGPQALAQMLRSAASGYFGKQCQAG